MYRTIVVALDGSPLAERAVPGAAAIAGAAGARLVIVRAVGPRPHRTDAERGAEAERYLHTVRADLVELAPDRIEAVLYGGDATEAILAEVRLRQADLVVMSTHARSGLGRWLHGSVADEVLRHAGVPVLLVPTSGPTSGPTSVPPAWASGTTHRILVPLDGSSLAEEVLPAAAELASVLGADLVLLGVLVPHATSTGGEDVYVAEDPGTDLAGAVAALDRVAAPLRARGLAVRVRVDVGEAAPTITWTARDVQASIIAMATHGRSGPARLVLGSVATGTLQRADVPVLLVRPQAMHPGTLARDTAASRSTHTPAPTGSGAS